jgi:hypothetical protein
MPDDQVNLRKARYKDPKPGFYHIGGGIYPSGFGFEDRFIDPQADEAQ